MNLIGCSLVLVVTFIIVWLNRSGLEMDVFIFLKDHYKDAGMQVPDTAGETVLEIALTVIIAIFVITNILSGEYFSYFA